MTKTIAVSEDNHKWLSSLKLYKMETMNEVVLRLKTQIDVLLEANRELNERIKNKKRRF